MQYVWLFFTMMTNNSMELLFFCTITRWLSLNYYVRLYLPELQYHFLKKTLCNGNDSKKNFGSFKKQFGFAKYSSFKGCVQYSETLSTPPIKLPSLIFDLALISVIWCIIYTGKLSFLLQIYFEKVFESARK